MIGFLSRDDWSIGGQGEVDTWIGHQVSLEFCQVDIQGSIKSQGRSDGGDNLTNKSVKMKTKYDMLTIENM